MSIRPGFFSVGLAEGSGSRKLRVKSTLTYFTSVKYIPTIGTIHRQSGKTHTRLPLMESPRQNTPDARLAGTPAEGLAGTSSSPPAGFVAESVFARFQQIQVVLTPVIGHGGVTALYERSRHLSGRSHPWLAPPKEGMNSGMDLDELKLLVANQGSESAVAGAGFLFRSFHDLFAGMVGEALARQLLGAAPSAEPSSGETP